jgi:HK97 family phage portal protein
MTFQDWMEFTSASKELTGASYTEIVYDSYGTDGTPTGIPIELYPMLSHRMKPVPHPKNFVSGFIYSISKEEIKFSPDEVIWFKSTNPKDQYYGASPLRPAELSVIVDMYASIYNKSFFKNSAIPAGVLESDVELSTPVIKRLKREWSKFYQGPSKAFFLAVLEQGLKYHTIAPNARDMQFAQLRDRNRDEILACYGVPGTIAGVRGANYSLSAEEWQQYWSETIHPKLKRMESQLNRFFVPKFKDPSLYLEFDTDSIMATRANKESETRIAASQIDRGMITINEWRQTQGKPDVDWGDEWMMPMNLQPADQLTGNTQLGGQQGFNLGAGAKRPIPGMVTPPSQEGIGKTYLPYSMVIKLLEAKGNNGGVKLLTDSGSVVEGDTELSPFQLAKLKQLQTILRKLG